MSRYAHHPPPHSRVTVSSKRASLTGFGIKMAPAGARSCPSAPCAHDDCATMSCPRRREAACTSRERTSPVDRHRDAQWSRRCAPAARSGDIPHDAWTRVLRFVAVSALDRRCGGEPASELCRDAPPSCTATDRTTGTAIDMASRRSCRHARRPRLEFASSATRLECPETQVAVLLKARLHGRVGGG